jgi:hypothetical protein
MAGHGSALFDCDKMLECRKKDAINSMPSCVARMVAGQEKLECSCSGKSFQITDVMDGGGFATLLRGKVHMRPSDKGQVSCSMLIRVTKGLCQHNCE